MNEVFCMAASILWLPNAPFSIRTLSGQSQKDGPTSSYFLWVICASTLWNCILYTSPAELTKLASRLSRLPKTAVYIWNRLECIKTTYLKQRPRVACKPFLVRLSRCPFSRRHSSLIGSRLFNISLLECNSRGYHLQCHAFNSGSNFDPRIDTYCCYLDVSPFLFFSFRSARRR